MRSDNAKPVIARKLGEEDRETATVEEVYNTVRFTRGMGDSGYKLEIVEKQCPVCRYDRLFRKHQVNPELRDQVKYWCMSPHCPHAVGDTFSYIQGPYNPNEPKITTRSQTEI